MAKSAKAEVEVTASSKTLAAKLREARAKFATFGNELKKNVFGKDLVDPKGGFWGKGGAQMMGNLGSGAASMAGGFLVDQAKGVLDFNDALTRLQITAGNTPEEMKAYAQEVRKASDETGLGKDKILAAGAAYVALTGDMATAMTATSQWARVAQATNSSVDDIAKTAAAMSQNMKIGPEDMEATFAALAIQGKKGAIELKDLAAQLSTIAPQWAMFRGGTGVAGVKELGAALQIVKRGFGGDAGETVTGLQSLLNALVKNAKRFDKGGVKIFDIDPKTGVKTMKSVFEIVDSIGNSKLMKDPTKLEKAFGRVEAYRAFLQLKENKGALDDLVKASDDVGVIQRDLSTYMQSDAGRMTDAWTKAKNAIADAFTPQRIEAFVHAVEELAPKLEGIAKTVGLIGEGLGFFYGIGKSMRGWIGGGGHKEHRHEDDIMLGKYGGTGPGSMYSQYTHGMSPDEIQNRKNAAYVSELAVDNFNKSVDSIMGGEKDDKSTPESIRRAVMAVYNGESDTGPQAGKYEAGRAYLDNAGVNPEQYAKGMFASAGKELAPELIATMQSLSKAVEQLAQAGSTFAIDGTSVVKGTKNAPIHRTRPRG